MSTLVVIPSIRAISLPYIEQLLFGADLLVVDDADGNVRYTTDEGATGIDHLEAVQRMPAGSTLRHFTRGSIEAYLRSRSWEGMLACIPQKNPSCKNFGLFFAWVNGYERIVLLDDDCDTRITPGFLDRSPVTEIGRPLMPATEFHTHSGWVNPTALLADAPFYSRGYPYEFRGESQRIQWHEPSGMETIVLNEGLWAGTPDINGVDKLHHERTGDPVIAVTDEHRRLLQQHQSVIVPHRGKLPLSIMNVQLRASIVPQFWQPPDFVLPGGWRIRRHDDVWASLVLGHVLPADQLRTAGGPLIWHRKAGDPIAEVLSEHPTNLAQRYLTEVMDMDNDYTVEGLLDAAHTLYGVSPTDQLAAAVVHYLRGALLWETSLTRIQHGAAVT